MSKKSRKRNRRILGALAALGTGLALANRGKGTEMSNVSVDSGRGSRLRPTVDDVQFKEQIVSTPVSTKTTIMDSMPARPKKNPLSKRVTDKGEVYTIKGGNTGVGNPKTAFVGDKYIYRDGKPYTKGRFGTFAAQKQMERGALPPQLRVPKIKNPYQGSMSGLVEGDFAAKKGGRATKSGFKRKGAAKRGFGRAYKGGK